MVFQFTNYVRRCIQGTQMKCDTFENLSNFETYSVPENTKQSKRVLIGKEFEPQFRFDTHSPGCIHIVELVKSHKKSQLQENGKRKVFVLISEFDISFTTKVDALSLMDLCINEHTPGHPPPVLNPPKEKLYLLGSGFRSINRRQIQNSSFCGNVCFTHRFGRLSSF